MAAKVLWGAWLLGVFLGLVLFSAAFEFQWWMPNAHQDSLGWAACAAVLGAATGLTLGIVPGREYFRRLSAIAQRRISAGVVLVVVAVSVACGGFYYNSDTLLPHVIAYAYTFAVVGYAITYVFEVGS